MGRHTPALLGGLLIGVLSSLPIIKAGNVCCCLWVVLGGLLTVYLEQQKTPDPIETGDAAVGGLLAGLIGAVIAGAVTAVMMMVVGPIAQDALQQALANNPQIPPEVQDFMQKFMTGRNLVLLSFAIDLPVFAVFGMLGGLLGAAIFKKKLPPQVMG